MRYRTMVFSQDWKKLNDRVFATMRVHRGDMKYSPDEKVQVVSESKNFVAHVLLRCEWKLKDLPLGFLEYDLEAEPGESRQDLINKLGRLYKLPDKPTPQDTVTLYFLERIKE